MKLQGLRQLAAWVLLMGTLCDVAGAQADLSPALDPGTSGSPGETEQLVQVLTLEDTLARVRQNHPLLEAAELERRMAAARLLERQGAFDPSLQGVSSQYRYNSTDNPGKAKFGSENSAAVGLATRLGAELYAGGRYNNDEVKHPESVTGEAGQYFLGAKLPLLRGGWGINPRAAAERKALIGQPLADAEFTEYRLALLLKSADYYWDWVAAKQATDAQRTLLELAELRSRQVRERAELGDLPLIDATEAEQEVQRRQEMVLKAIREFQKMAYNFSFYLWNDLGTETILPRQEMAPPAIPVPEVLSENDIADAKRQALQFRPELAQIRATRDITNIDLALARNQLLPVLDAYAEPGYDAGGQAVGAVIKAGVVVSVPLRNRTARGQIEQSRLRLEKLSLQEQATIQQIMVEVSDTASQLNLAVARVQAAQQAYDLARQLAAGERTRFDYGDSTLFLLNQRERTAAEALLMVIEAKAEAQRAAVRLQAVTGQL